MKPLQGDSENNNSCSCTCDSNSESDRQTLQGLLAQGSRINRLLTGKYYIHIRDGYLLDNLIKTRALYDTLRSQLLSSSESSPADLNPKQSCREITKAFVEAKKSSDIFTLVDLVDKGAVIGLKKLSECCSCCTCSSKFRLHENVQKGRRNRQAHPGGNIASRSSLALKQESGETKNIKSDPCTCACNKHENIKKSREMSEKIRPGLQIIERDRLFTASNNHTLISPNNSKLRKSYHKLKRGNGRSPYIENIGEGGNKPMRKSNIVQDIAIEKTKSIELLKLAQKTIIDSFATDRQTLKKKEPVASSKAGNSAEESKIPVKKAATKSKDQVGKHQAQSPELKKKLAHRWRKKKQVGKENKIECMCKISDTSSTSNKSTLKGAPFITGNERQKNHSRAKKKNKKLLQQAANFAESNTEISKKPKEFNASGGSNQVQKSKESKIPPKKDPAEVVNKKMKKTPFSTTPVKKSIKSNTVTIPGIQKSVSINSITKSYPASYNKTSSNSLTKINKSILKSKSSVLNRKRLRLLSAPLRYRPHPQMSNERNPHKDTARHKKSLLQEAPRPSEEPRRHKKPSGLKQKHIKSGSHALKRCLCTLKLKINEKKFRISKNVSNENLNVTDKQSINSKNSLSSMKTLIKASNLNLNESKYITGHATKCECSDYVNQSQAIRRNKRPTQNKTNAHLEIKYNVTKDKQAKQETIKYDSAQDMSNKKKLSIHSSISDCMCNEIEKNMYRQGQPNIEFGVKSSSNHHVSNNNKTKTQGKHADKNNSYNINSPIRASKCECFDANTEEKGRYKDQFGKSKSALKDASITTEKPRKLQNQYVQTVININEKQNQEIEVSLKQLEKNKPYTCNPSISIELLNKGYSSNGLKLTQSKLKFLYKCGDGSKKLPNKQSQTSSFTQRSKFTSTKHGLRKCFCTLQLRKQEKIKKSKKKVSKLTIIQPKSYVEGSQSQAKLKLVRYDKLPYKYEFSISCPKKCFSRQLKVALIKREERSSKKRIKNKLRSNFSLISRSMQLPRTKKIYSILISHNSEILTPLIKRTKTKSVNISTHPVRLIFSRKLFKSKHSSCLYSPIGKDNKMCKDTKISYSKDLQNTLLRNKKQEKSLLLGLTNKSCLCTFKLRKTGKHYKKNSLVKIDTKSNIIADKINPKFQKGTYLTKSKYSNQLRPYESKYLEPFILEKNKSNTFKNFGIVTEKTEMKSRSSDTRNLRSPSKLLFVKSDLQQRNTSLQKFKKMRKCSELSHLSQHAREMYLNNFFKQSVKMGSNFSFNIEFYKGITPENNFNQNKSKNMNVHFLHNKQEYNLLTKRYSSNRNTHLGTKRVSPTTNRCLCTLKISKMDEQLRNSKLLLPFETKKLTKVYAVSTVAIAENKIKTPEILEVGHGFHCIDSYYPTYSKNSSSHTNQWQYFKKKSTSGLSISMIAFKTKNVQSYIRESKYKLLQISSKDQSLLDFTSNESVRFETAFSCEIDYLKNICSKKRRILRSAQSHNDTLALRQCIPENPKTQKSQNITSLSQLTGVQPLLRRCYCTMNIQVASQKRKLLDYECEPGICIPDECDPYECQKLIMKRLMRQVSRMSGTDSRSRSSSSETSPTGSRTRKIQSGFGEPKVLKHRTRGHGPRSKPTRKHQSGLKYQTLPRPAKAPAPAHRQAVRVGSSFSFDIEFSKGGSKSAPTADSVKVPKRQTSSRSSKTYHRHDVSRGTKNRGRRHHRETQSMMKQMRHRASNVTPMLKRCFCTLKLQKKGRQQKERELRGIDHGTSTPPKFSVEKPVRRTERGQNTKRKLLPYECEPGICVPGECDPYECLELIKRRNKHTKDSGTESMASSISSSSMTSSQKRKRKRMQSRNIRAKQVSRSIDTSVKSKPSVMSIDRPGQDRQVVDRPSKPSRQAVKISSNFSFNIEFYKDKTGSYSESDRRPSEVYVQKTPKGVRKVPKNVYAHRRMRESSSQHGKRTRDDDSQIGIYQRGRSTMTSGFLKRCFCTAELQGINVDAATGARRHRSLAKYLKSMSASKRHRRGSNVGHERARPILDKRVGMTQTRQRFPSLLPHECEPGVCEPGFCDPNECIKLIRKRLAKEKMTGTAGPRTKSTSSCYSSCNRSRPRMTQSRSDWSSSKGTQSRTARRRERGRRRDYAPRDRGHQETFVPPASPQRQAVRIGSNFSFNIEFYKDKTSTNLDVQAAAPLVKSSRPIRMRDRGYGAYRRVRTSDRGLRGRRFPALSRDSQVDPTISKDVGLSPILRRCFCTLKLQKKSKRKAMTKGKTKAVTKAETKASQMHPTKSKDKTLGSTLKRCLCKLKPQKQSKTESLIKPASKAVTNAASKAGTEASSKGKTKAVTKGKTKAVTKGKMKAVSRDASKAEVKAETKASQMHPTKKKDKTLGSTLKNCLCKLKPQKLSKTESLVKPASKAIIKAESNQTQTKESVMIAKKAKESIVALKKPKRRKAFPYKLERYECEPGICVPGECDPYECLKLINKRLMYSSGTSTDRRGARSTSNMTNYRRGHRHSETQSFMQGKKPTRTRDTRTRDTERRPHREKKRAYKERRPESRSTEYKSTVVEKDTKQAVKIGSGFNFDIEFFKDKTHGGSVVTSRPLKREAAYDKPRRTSSRSTEGRSPYYRDKKAQLSRANRDIDSQALGPSTRSTPTGTPFLKRCFCTLQLHCKTENQGSPFDCVSDRTDSTDRQKKNILRRTQARSNPFKTSQCDVRCPDVTGSQTTTSSSDERTKHKAVTKARSYSPNWRYEKISRRNNKKSQGIGTTSRRIDKTSRRNDKTTGYDDDNPNRHAINIGSNVSFSIEIFKDKSPQIPSVPEVNKIDKKVARSKTKTKGREVQPQPQVRSDIKVKGTQALKRCFCTLKLEKKGKQQYVTPTCKCASTNTKSKSKTKAKIEPVAREIGTGTQKPGQCKCDNSPKEKKRKSNKSCKCEIDGEFSCKEGKECKCCICNTYALKTNGPRCKKSKDCKCAKCNTPILKPNEIPCKKGKACKCCKCQAANAPLKQSKKDNSPKAKKCECIVMKPLQSTKKAKKSNCKCIGSCLCETDQKSEIVKTSDKKTSTKRKYDPSQKPDIHPKRTSRISSMAAQFVPGYTHKRAIYKGEPYSPENIGRIVEEPRYPFLHGKDTRQGVKITSDFSFNIEFFKELLPPLVDKVKKKDNSTGPQSRPDRTKTASSPVAMMKNCLCKSILQKSIHPQSVAVCRVEEIRPMAFFQPKQYWVQYQTQRTKKYFKTNPQELETIMSYSPSRYDKINHNKECRRKINFGRVDRTKTGAHLKSIPKDSETKQSTLKKMFYYCKNLFTKRLNIQNIKNTERCMEFKKKATNRQPLIDLLKPSKSERHPNKAAIADIKKSKSLKVARGSGKDNYKNKYSRLQSGDHQSTKSKNTGMKLKKTSQHCQIKFKHAIPINEKVHFTTLRTNKALKCKPNDAIVSEQKTDTKPVSFLFKSLKFKHSEDIKYLKLCSCCGGIKRIRNLPSASNYLDIKKIKMEYSEDAITSVIPKDFIAMPTKSDITEEESALSKENQKKHKQACPCCVCKSISKPRTKQGIKGGLGVCGSILCYRAEIHAKNTHHAGCIKCKRIRETSICPAESEKEALATESEYYRAPNKKKRNKKLELEAKTRGNFHKGADKKIIEKKKKKKCYSKKLTKYKNMPDSMLVAESVLDMSKLELKSKRDIFGYLRKCQSYLLYPMRPWKKFQKPANNGPSVETMQFLKLSCQARKCVKEGEEILEDCPVTNFAKHSNNVDRRKGFHSKKLSWRRHPGCGFGWSPFMLSLRKRPWLSAYYKCAGFYPHCLTILQVWRQFMDIILFLLAVAVWSPCLLGIELYRALKCCFLCKV